MIIWYKMFWLQQVHNLLCQLLKPIHINLRYHQPIHIMVEYVLYSIIMSINYSSQQLWFDQGQNRISKKKILFCVECTTLLLFWYEKWCRQLNAKTWYATQVNTTPHIIFLGITTCVSNWNIKHWISVEIIWKLGYWDIPWIVCK